MSVLIFFRLPLARSYSAVDAIVSARSMCERLPTGDNGRRTQLRLLPTKSQRETEKISKGVWRGLSKNFFSHFFEVSFWYGTAIPAISGPNERFKRVRLPCVSRPSPVRLPLSPVVSRRLPLAAVRTLTLRTQLRLLPSTSQRETEQNQDGHNSV